MTVVQFPARAGDGLLHGVRTEFGAHPAPCPMHAVELRWVYRVHDARNVPTRQVQAFPSSESLSNEARHSSAPCFQGPLETNALNTALPLA
jgi:hypothetical protein